MSQVETALHITKSAVDKPSKKGPNYGAYHDGNAIGPLRLPAWGASDNMMAKVSDKKAIFGALRKEVGGRGRVVEEQDDTPAAKRARLAASQDELEPVFLHSAGLGYYEDEIFMGNYSGVIDFTPGQGYLVWAAIQNKIPVVAFCMSPNHREMLRIHLLSLALKQMAKEGSPSYEPRLHALIADSGDATLPTPKAKAGPNRPRPGRASGTRTKKVKQEEEDPDDAEEEPEEPQAAEEPPADPAKAVESAAEAKLLATLNKLNAKAASPA